MRINKVIEMQTATESQPPWAPGDAENKGTVHTTPSNEGRRMLNVKHRAQGSTRACCCRYN